MRQSEPMRVMVYRPVTEAGRRALAGRAAEVHAGFAAEVICRLDCPPEQKLELLEAVIDTARGAWTPPAQQEQNR